jgi:hypothetical protein
MSFYDGHENHSLCDDCADEVQSSKAYRRHNREHAVIRHLEQRFVLCPGCAYEEAVYEDSVRELDLMLRDIEDTVRAGYETKGPAPMSDRVDNSAGDGNMQCECDACESQTDAPSDDPEATLDLILIAGTEERVAGEVIETTGWLNVVKSWTPEQRRAVEDYCGAVHLRASDNDDVEVPPRPAILDSLRAARTSCAGR